MISKLQSKFFFEARKFGHFRFKEPIVVIESDDWGKMGNESNFQFSKEEWKTDVWNLDRLETQEELNALYSVLEFHQSKFIKGPIFTANCIVSNPSVAKTKATDYQTLVLESLDTSSPSLAKLAKSGRTRGVFYPQYHGRLHYHPDDYLNSLRENSKAQTLFEAQVHGGLSFLKNAKNAYYSEYFSYKNGSSTPELSHWLAKGLDDFERIFGYKSESTIAPNFVFDIKDKAVLIENGIKYLQGGNMLLTKVKGQEQAKNFCMGTSLDQSLTILTRNHKFEPCRGKMEWQAEFSIGAVKSWTTKNIPAVLDTHRLNYVGKHAQKSLVQLHELLQGLAEIDGLRFLTSVELGEAMTQKGRYTNAITGEKEQLTPMFKPLGRQIRKWIH
jgi:hypothetical protein